MGKNGKSIWKTILKGAVAIGIALIVEIVGLGQYVATYFTTPYPLNLVWRNTLMIVMAIVGIWSIYLAWKGDKR